jgi:pectin lyase
MKLLALLLLAATNVRAAGVTGAAEGFAKGVTGGGSATPVYPNTIADLVSYLGDSSPRVIILTKTYVVYCSSTETHTDLTCTHSFDFTGSEGTTTGTGCAPWGTASGCQLAINKDNWCTNYQPNAPTASVS